MMRSKVRLTWDTPRDIAIALEDAYPNVTRVGLSHDELKRMITGLQGFADRAEPPSTRTLDRILFMWIDLEPDDGDSRWDAYA